MFAPTILLCLSLPLSVCLSLSLCLSVQRSLNDEFIIIASDGLYDVVSNDEACRFVQRNLLALSTRGLDRGSSRSKKLGSVSEQTVNIVANKLVQFALKKGSLDNVTAVIVMLHQ